MKKLYKSVFAVTVTVIFSILFQTIILFPFIVSAEEISDDYPINYYDHHADNPIIYETVHFQNQRICEPDGNVNQEWLNEINNQLEYLPLCITDDFQKRGWRFFLTERNLANDILGGAYGSSVQGYTGFREKMIIIDNREAAVKGSPLHEIGHYYNSVILRGCCLSDSFLDAYYIEGKIFVDTFNVGFCVDNAEECFCEAFAYYYNEKKEKLMETCPMIYSYLETVLPDDW